MGNRTVNLPWATVITKEANTGTAQFLPATPYKPRLPALSAGIVLLGVGFLLGSSSTPAPPPALVASSLTIVDDQGRSRILLGVDPVDGAAFLRILAPDGSERFLLTADRGGSPDAALSLKGAGGVEVSLVAAKSSARVELVAEEGGTSLLLDAFASPLGEGLSGGGGEGPGGGASLRGLGRRDDKGSADTFFALAFQEVGGASLVLADPRSKRRHRIDAGGEHGGSSVTGGVRKLRVQPEEVGEP